MGGRSLSSVGGNGVSSSLERTFQPCTMRRCLKRLLVYLNLCIHRTNSPESSRIVCGHSSGCWRRLWTDDGETRSKTPGDAMAH